MNEPSSNLCVLCQRPVEGNAFLNRDYAWPTCGHGRFPRHADCMNALNRTFPMNNMEARSAAFAAASCPVCGCGCEHT